MKRKSKRFVLLICVLALAGAVAVGLYQAAEHTADGEAMPDGGARTWTCPMHSNVITEKPGDCPVCSMRLVPAESTETDK